MPSKPKTSRPVHANAGVEADYRRVLSQMVDEMRRSCERWIEAKYKAAPPRVAELAEDATPSEMMRKLLKDLAKRWISRFEESAPKIAEKYVRQMFKRTDSAFMMALKDAGWMVQFKTTPSINDALQASIAENVGLIKSIPEQYLNKVDGIVMRSYTAGRDLETMTREIRSLYPVTKRRAALIARDQSNKANATCNRTRQLELGIEEAIWMHSHAGKEPRPDHVAANGKRYKIAEGCLISGEYIQPGYKINCRCTSKPILPGL